MIDSSKYSSLMDAVSDIPDPRKARGQRHPWPLILTLICAALVCGQRSGRASGQWVQEHTVDLVTQLPVRRRPLPRTSTLRRALRSLDISALEDRLRHFSADLDRTLPPPPSTEPWQGQAIDGKALRGANRHGANVHLVSLVWHGSGRVRKQVRVTDKSNEITAAPRVLAGFDLQGTVTTMDSLLCQQAIARQILEQHGHYLTVVKENQPALHGAIALVFEQPPPPQPSDHNQSHSYDEKGHGRLETRTLERTAAVNGYVEWPGVGQVLRRTCERLNLTTGEVSRKVTYGVTSLRPEEASAKQVEKLWREHWGIENKLHYVRDVTMGEDGGQMRVGQAPHALAALRNGIVTVVRSQGVTRIADGLREHGASVQTALALIGIAF